jgi:hypothetical protein
MSTPDRQAGRWGKATRTDKKVEQPAEHCAPPHRALCETAQELQMHLQRAHHEPTAVSDASKTHGPCRPYMALEQIKVEAANLAVLRT